MKPRGGEPEELECLARTDRRLAAAMRRLPRFPGVPDRTDRRRRTDFSTLASAICWQMISTRAAQAIWDRACALTPGPDFPRAAELVRMSDAELRAVGFSRAKTASLFDLAERIVDGRLRLRALRAQGDEDVVRELTTVRGIGLWSAQIFLMFRLGRLDVMPATDLGIREGLQHLDRLSERPSSATVLERTARWSPRRTIGAWYLWRLVHEARGDERPSGRTRAGETGRR